MRWGREMDPHWRGRLPTGYGTVILYKSCSRSQRKDVWKPNGLFTYTNPAWRDSEKLERSLKEHG